MMQLQEVIDTLVNDVREIADQEEILDTPVTHPSLTDPLRCQAKGCQAVATHFLVRSDAHRGQMCCDQDIELVKQQMREAAPSMLLAYIVDQASKKLAEGKDHAEES